MKIERDLDLILKKIENKEPLHIIYDNEDFGIYKYSQKENKYYGMIGFLDVETIIRAARDKNYFIQIQN